MTACDKRNNLTTEFLPRTKTPVLFCDDTQGRTVSSKDASALSLDPSRTRVKSESLLKFGEAVNVNLVKFMLI